MDFAATNPFLSKMATADAAMVRAKAGLAAQQTAQNSKLDPKKLQEIDDSAKDFESMFISQMLQPMFDTVQTDSMFGGGQGEDTWKGMMIEQYGREISNAGGIGLSDDIKAKMIEMQEIAQNGTTGETQ